MRFTRRADRKWRFERLLVDNHRCDTSRIMSLLDGVRSKFRTFMTYQGTEKE